MRNATAVADTRYLGKLFVLLLAQSLRLIMRTIFRRYETAINLYRQFGRKPGSPPPLYYKQFIGSTPDVSAFADVLTESILKHSDSTVIADKGFVSESDFWTARFQKSQISHSSSLRQQIR